VGEVAVPGDAAGRSTVTGQRGAQPAVFAYGDLVGSGAYARPGALVVAGRDNYGDPRIRDISAAGGTVLVYLNTIIDNPAGRYHALLLGESSCGPPVPRWPGQPVANRWGHLNDFRVGGIEQAKIECVLETIVAENPHMAGFMADDIGSRSWFTGFDWSAWPPEDQQAYRDGAVALMHTIRRVADRHGLVVLVNGSWSAGTLAAEGGGYPDPDVSGNALADGTVVEHHDTDAAFFVPYACSPQWGSAREGSIVVAVTRTDAGRESYGREGCVDFTVTQVDYDFLVPPWGEFRPVGLPNAVSR
jgi:hypothetical protein